MTDDLHDFGEELSRVQTDTTMEWAAVKSATVCRRTDYHSDVDRNDDNATDRGLQITFETASGKQITRWYEKPDEWNPLHSDLVLLFAFWDLTPDEIEKLNDGVDYEVPLEYDPYEEEWNLSWSEIEEGAGYGG